jgi:hypothetical protein
MIVELLSLVVIAIATALRRRPFACSSNSVARVIAFENSLSIPSLPYGTSQYCAINPKHLY